MSILNYHHLRYFLAIAQAGTLTRAAVRGLDTAKRTTVRIGAMATLSRNFQVTFLQPIVGRADARIVIRSGSMRELLHMLEAHHIDVLLTNTLPPRDETTTWTPHILADQPISLVGRPLGRGKRTSVKHLLETAPLIVPTIENHIRGEFDAFAERLGVTPLIAAEVDDMAMVRLLAREGLGMAVAPPIVVRDELAAGDLREFGPLPGLKETFYAITPNRRFPNPLVKELMNAQGRKKTLPREGHR